MIPASFITTRRGKKDSPKPEQKMADVNTGAEQAGVTDDAVDKEITLKDLYQLTLSVKKEFATGINVQKSKQRN